MPTITTDLVPLSELAAEMHVPEEVALDLARRAGAKTFGRSWKGESMVPLKVAEKALADRRAEIEAADRRRLEFDAEHRKWVQDYAAAKAEAYRAKAATFTTAELAGEEERYLSYGWSTIGVTAPVVTSRAHAAATAAANEAMRTWLKKHPEPQP